MPRLGRRLLPFSAAATPLQAVTYLVGVSLFSISFLVFLNSAVSFVVTDLLGRKHGVGDVVGTLGFVDEIVALVACPLWGLASDRLGVRWVAVCGYLVIAVSLAAFVPLPSGYPLRTKSSNSLRTAVASIFARGRRCARTTGRRVSEPSPSHSKWRSFSNRSLQYAWDS